MPFHDIKLNDGRSIPAIGFGSWKIPRDQATQQTDQAIEVGFDHIDTAQVYYNEEEVGRAIKESGLSRKEVWITTKWSGVDGKGPTQSCNESLEKLGIDYIDLYLIHSPRLVQGDYKGKWEEMEQLVKEGKVKSIGVSNFKVDDLKILLKHARIKPVVNQILLHPYVIKETEPLLAYMKDHHIVPEAYSALIPITQHPDGPVTELVNKIAEKLGKKPEQVLLAWVRAKHAVIVTTSSRKERLQGYLEVGDIELSHDDVKAIDHAGAKGYLRSSITKRAVVAAKVIGVSAAAYLLVSTMMSGCPHSM